MRIAILPVGPVDEATLEGIRHSLSKVFPDTIVTVLREVLPIPSGAYNSRRRQHNSSIIMPHIGAFHRKVDADRILGITEADLYVPGLNFVFGEALSLRGPAIISLYRLRPDFYGESLDEELYLERASKEAVHEIGHTLGLGHCRDPKCVMFFSNSILDTDRKNQTFCDDCYLNVLQNTPRD